MSSYKETVLFFECFFPPTKKKYRFLLTLRLYSTGPFRNSGSHSSGSGHATGRVIFPPAA